MQDAGLGEREESGRSCCDAEACGEVPLHTCVACRVRNIEAMTVHLSVTWAERYIHEVCVSVAHMVVAHVRMARTWAARADGAGVSLIALGGSWLRFGRDARACIGSWHGLSDEGTSGSQLLG